MIKKLYQSGLIASVVLLALSGCSDQFMRDKTNYNLVSPDAVYTDYNAALARVDYLYSVFLPGPNSGREYFFNWSTYGQSDVRSQSTEEYGSIDKDKNYWINEAGLDITQGTSFKEESGDFFYFEMKEMGPYGRIRECNDVIERVMASEFTDEEKAGLLGQAYFWRAFAYWTVVKHMGGVPIIDKVQDPIVGDGTKESIIIPRSTTKECIDFICNDFQTAADYLPVAWNNQAADYGRITKGAALAFKGRTRLLYASPLFNRQDKIDRWQLAYDANKEAKEMLSYSLDPGTNGSGWARMFAPKEIVHPEAVLVTLYSVHQDRGKRNNWENSIRPKNIYGGGGVEVTAQMIDLFPMGDGKTPKGLGYTKLDSSEYNRSLFFLNRDPRFYRTFAFPGVKWAANANLSGVRDDTLGKFLYPYQGTNYELWSYAWYNDVDKMKDELFTSNSWVADGIGDDRKTVFLRKRSDDYDVAKTSMYEFVDSTSIRFNRSYAPYMELRYGEVLLNFAEAACGAGKGDEALEALRELRRRVGYSGDCGLSNSLAGDRAALFAAILYERQIELAYEGKRFDDMRRWMLWDGGANQFMVEGAPDNWMPTGWEGNTCKYLGVPPLNGTRRQRIYVYYKNDVVGSNGLKNNQMVYRKSEETPYPDSLVLYDPIMIAAEAGDEKAIRPAALNLMTDAVTQDGAVMAKLIDFYQNNLGVKRPNNWDGTETVNEITVPTDQTVDFKPVNYFIGLKNGAQGGNPTLLQTIGWTDRQGHGVWFDPLAE